MYFLTVNTLGAFDGLFVGAFEGSDAGLLVGLIGLCVGAFEGSDVGLLVGMIGLCVGAFEGSDVGLLVGLIGLCVGLLDGALEELAVGLVDGALLGLDVGDRVGCLLGLDVGLFVGKLVGNAVGTSNIVTAAKRFALPTASLLGQTSVKSSSPVTPMYSATEFQMLSQGVLGTILLPMLSGEST
jgi:hypothetical protein